MLGPRVRALFFSVSVLLAHSRAHLARLRSQVTKRAFRGNRGFLSGVICRNGVVGRSVAAAARESRRKSRAPPLETRSRKRDSPRALISRSRLSAPATLQDLAFRYRPLRRVTAITNLRRRED